MDRMATCGHSEGEGVQNIHYGPATFFPSPTECMTLSLFLHSPYGNISIIICYQLQIDNIAAAKIIIIGKMHVG